MVMLFYGPLKFKILKNRSYEIEKKKESDLDTFAVCLCKRYRKFILSRNMTESVSLCVSVRECVCLWERPCVRDSV